MIESAAELLPAGESDLIEIVVSLDERLLCWLNLDMPIWIQAKDVKVLVYFFDTPMAAQDRIVDFLLTSKAAITPDD